MSDETDREGQKTRAEAIHAKIKQLQSGDTNPPPPEPEAKSKSPRELIETEMAKRKKKRKRRGTDSNTD
jgi:hypothetical protein